MGFSYDNSYTEYQKSRSLLRKFIRRAYLKTAAGLLKGPTIDFGCGLGELLGRLPLGSVGLEVNAATVRYCRALGLQVTYYDADTDDWSLSPIGDQAGFQSLAISHVLEHLVQPMDKLNKLLRACERLGVNQVLAIVPGRKGYSSDATHVTFVDTETLTSPLVTAGTDFTVDYCAHYPVNCASFGNYFTHNELRVRYVRQ